MRITALLLLVLAAAPADGQVPPEIRMDQLVLRAERLAEGDDPEGAVMVMYEAFTLAAEHGLELPADLRFEHARRALAVGLLHTAKGYATDYLTAAGREGESYQDALVLLEDVDAILEQRPECLPKPTNSGCWMELASHPGCYVWYVDLVSLPDETATWTGECSAGFAQGPGTVTYFGGVQEHEGNRRYGKPHGESVIRSSSGWVESGPFRFGKRHGDWRERSGFGGVSYGPYVDDKRNGHWWLQIESGVHFRGPYVDGERHGHWVESFADGQAQEGPFVDDYKHGRWTVRSPDGDTFYVTFVRGRRQEP